MQSHSNTIRALLHMFQSYSGDMLAPSPESREFSDDSLELQKTQISQPVEPPLLTFLSSFVCHLTLPLCNIVLTNSFCYSPPLLSSLSAISLHSPLSPQFFCLPPPLSSLLLIPLLNLFCFTRPQNPPISYSLLFLSLYFFTFNLLFSSHSPPFSISKFSMIAK